MYIDIEKSNKIFWKKICEEFCKQNNYELLFINSDNFGYADTKGGLHHVYAEELAKMLEGRNENAIR